MKTIYMETTQVSASKTAGEVMALLVAVGAKQITVQYDDCARVSGMAFVLIVNGTVLAFALPARIAPVFQTMWDRGYKAAKYKRNYDTEERRRSTMEQAERVAWRQLLRWAQAQIAMIQTGMVHTSEVFLPYLQNNEGKSLYEVVATSHFKALLPPKENENHE